MSRYTFEDLERDLDPQSNARFDVGKSGLRIEMLLEKGSSANVFVARYTGANCHDDEARSKRVILKMLIKNVDKSGEDLAMLKKESSAMIALQGQPNIVGFNGISWIEEGIDDERIHLPCWAMQMEYCKGGDLHSRTSARRFDEIEALALMQGVFRGLSYIHERGYVHRDIKPENILWADGLAKISDFGICCHRSNEQEMRRKCGSPGYIAPEMILRQAYCSNVDCFSAGALLYFIVSGKLAFSGPDTTITLKRTVRCILDFRKSFRLECLSESCKEFMLDVTVKDPLERLTSKGALQHWWLCQETRSCIPRDEVLTARDFSEKSRPISQLSHGVTVAWASSGKSGSGGSDLLSDVSTFYCETSDSKENSVHAKESFSSAAGDRHKRNYSAAQNQAFEMPHDPTLPVGQPLKSRMPFFLRAQRSLKLASKPNDLQM